MNLSSDVLSSDTVVSISSASLRVFFLNVFVTSADKVGEVIFSVAFVCVLVCWFVCPDNNSKSLIAISINF